MTHEQRPRAGIEALTAQDREAQRGQTMLNSTLGEALQLATEPSDYGTHAQTAGGSYFPSVKIGETSYSSVSTDVRKVGNHPLSARFQVVADYPSEQPGTPNRSEILKLAADSFTEENKPKATELHVDGERITDPKQRINYAQTLSAIVEKLQDTNS